MAGRNGTEGQAQGGEVMKACVELVREVRELLANGVPVEEIPNVLEEDEAQVEAALQKALADRRSRPYDPQEVALLEMAYGHVHVRILALALGRSVSALKQRASALGIKKRRCPGCGNELLVEGFPFAGGSRQAGAIQWAVRCARCDLEVVYELNWREVSDAVCQHEASPTESKEA